MTFKFNFNSTPTSAPTPPKLSLLPAAQIHPTHKSTSEQHDYLLLPTTSLRLLKSTRTPPPHLSPPETDIVPATYEGGYKLWECATDLCEYLHENPALCTGKSALELGAGHALPSVVALKNGAKSVHVHDYNEEVIHDVSAVNMALNNATGDICYFCGAWDSLPEVLGRRYDLVLSAETVYAREQSEALARCVLETMGENGEAYVAGKSYYFGVGGGMSLFKNDVRVCAEQRGMKVEIVTVKEIRDGVSNVREIVRVSRCSHG